MLICCREEVKHFKTFLTQNRSSSLYIISLVCPVVVVLSIHPSRHPSKFLIPEEEDDGTGGGRMAAVYPNVYVIQSCSL
jgi:hypothetical protein